MCTVIVREAKTLNGRCFEATHARIFVETSGKQV